MQKVLASRSSRVSRAARVQSCGPGRTHERPHSLHSATTRAALAVLILISSCAHLPDTELYMQQGRDARHVPVEGARGLLSAERSAAIIASLKATGGDVDMLQKHIAVEEAVVGTPLTAGNNVTLLKNGPATYDAMFAAMRNAKRNINLESYIIEDDEVGRRFSDVLLEMQARGVQVNVIFDSVGCLKTPKEFFDRLRDGGIHVVEFNPVNPLAAKRGWLINNRDHRKLLVVDGRTAFVGGINISSVYSGSPSSSGSAPSKIPTSPGSSWRDTHIQIDGPAAVEFQKAFLATWAKQGGPALNEKDYVVPVAVKGNNLVRVVPSTPDDPYSTIYLTLVSAISNAEQQVYLTVAYFAPDPQLLKALLDAARRGVDVRMILPGQTDSELIFHAGRSHYAELLDAGVKVYERHGAILHSKTALIDGVWSSVGSTNLDWRSFLHNDEINASVVGREFAAQMQSMFNDDLAASDPIDPQQWPHRSLWLKLKEIGARVWEYWL